MKTTALEHATDVATFSSTLIEDVIHVEVLWFLKVVASHYSFNSFKDLSQTFPEMFPDNKIAQLFSCGATKCVYLAGFGIYLYFQEILTDKITLYFLTKV